MLYTYYVLPVVRPVDPVNFDQSEEVGPVVVMGFSIALIAFSLLLMLLVLMHKGKGGGLSDMFGGGMQSSVGGSSVAERNLDRITVVVGLLWFACIVVLGLVLKLDS
jgi:preprotein translocase subunit SecG